MIMDAINLMLSNEVNSENNLWNLYVKSAQEKERKSWKYRQNNEANNSN